MDEQAPRGAGVDHCDALEHFELQGRFGFEPAELARDFELQQPCIAHRREGGVGQPAKLVTFGDIVGEDGDDPIDPREELLAEIRC